MVGPEHAPDESTHLLPPNASDPSLHQRLPSPLYGRDATAGPIRSLYSGVFSRLSKAKRALGEKSAGKPLEINDYPAIDGLHDLVKDSLRLRSLYSRRGLGARTAQAWNAASGWVAAALMGTLTACVAFLVDVSVVTVSSWKQGYCRAGWWKAKDSCCKSYPIGIDAAASGFSFLHAYRRGGTVITGEGIVADACEDWRYWSNDYVSSYAIYVAFALAFGLFSGAVTLLTKNSLPAPAPVSGHLDYTSPHHLDATVTGSSDGHAPEILRDGDGTIGKKEIDPPPGKVIYMAAGSGIPEIKTIISGFVIPNYLDLKVLVVKAVGSVFAVSTGMCLGKEGPFVHISTCVANLVASLLPKYRDNGRQLREMLSAGCAAGLCVAFGAPIGGVLFSFEEISTNFNRKVLWRAFLCSLAAAAVLKYLNPTGTGKLVLFETNYGTDYAPRHYLVFVVLGIAGGIFGGTFCRLNFLWSRFFRGFALIKKHPVLEVAIVVLVTAISQYPNVVTREPGDVIIENLLVDCRHAEKERAWVCVHEHGDTSSRLAYMGWLIYGMFVKLFLTTITFGVKVPSGIIIPALNAGAFIGRLFGQFSFVTQSLQPGIFAMVGAVAFLAGVCRMTISLAVIMFELTGEVEYVIPDMIGILGAKWVADALEPEGVYDLAQTLLGHPFLDGDAALRITQREGVLVSELLPPVQDVGEITVQVPLSGCLPNRQAIRERFSILKRRGLMNPGLVLFSGDVLSGYLAEDEFEEGLARSHETDRADGPSGAWMHQAVRVLGEPRFDHDELDLTPFVDKAPLTIVRSTPMEYAVQMFSNLGLGYLCVVEERPGRLCGVIMRKNLLDWLNEKKKE